MRHGTASTALRLPRPQLGLLRLQLLLLQHKCWMAAGCLLASGSALTTSPASLLRLLLLQPKWIKP